MAPSIYLYEVLVESADLDAGAWKIIVENSLDTIGYEYERIGNKLRIWDPTAAQKKTPRKDVSYREGVEVFKVSMPRDYRYPVVGFNFSRLYFVDGENHPAYQSANQLFRNHEFPVVLRQVPLLKMLDGVIAKINKNKPVISPLDNIDWNCVSANIEVEGSCEISDIHSLSQVQYSRAILNMVRNKPAINPVNIEMTLIDAFVNDKKKAKEIASKTSEVLSEEWGCRISKHKISDNEGFEIWLNDRKDVKVGFLALEGKKGQRPDQAAIEWMKLMENARIPYTLFSASQEVNPVYTRHGNAMHILAKAGGFHFRVNPKSIPEFNDHWFIGLDLGYGAQYKGKCVVVTLTDSNGDLKVYWRAIKDSDETLKLEVLSEALSWIIEQAESIKPGQKYVVIRDGRCPHHELISHYRKLLPEGKSIFIEYTKKSNPLMVDQGRQPEPGTLAIPRGSQEAFLFTAKASQKDMVTNTTRFRPRINDLGYSLQQLGEMLTALCFSSKLSFQPSSIPAPIYWADGIASLSNVNLQFSGWSHLPSITRDFRGQHD